MRKNRLICQYVILSFFHISDTTVLDGDKNIDPLVHKDSDLLWNEKEGATNRITIANQGKCSHYLQQCDLRLL